MQHQNTAATIAFLDTEALGLDIDAPIWEIACVRREPSGREDTLHLMVKHDPGRWLDTLPEQFAADYRARYDAGVAYDPVSTACLLHSFLSGRPTIVGAVPNFDTERISHQLLRPHGLNEPWHYHLVDIETLIVGAGLGNAQPLVLPWDSNELSRSIGVDPGRFDRHTALGDVEWIRAQWDALTKAAVDA